MYSNQQPHSSGGNYQQQHPNASGLPAYGTSSLRHQTQTTYPRSSSVSSALDYQQVTPAEFNNRDIHQQHSYSHASIYTPDAHHQYTTSPVTPGAPISPFQTTGHRSGSDGIAYAMGNPDLNGTTAFRRPGQPMQPGGPSRARTMSLSYAQPAVAARSPSIEYSQQKYTQDPRYTSQPHPYQPPPISYRAGAASPPLASHPLPRPVPGRMSSNPDVHIRSSPLTTQPPIHPIPRRDSSASSTSQSYQPRTIEAATGNTSSTPSANQPRPHVCDMCGLAFVRGHDLKRHKDTHTNSKPHVCECGKSFSRKDALKRHVYLKSCRGEKLGGGYATSEE